MRVIRFHVLPTLTIYLPSHEYERALSCYHTGSELYRAYWLSLSTPPWLLKVRYHSMWIFVRIPRSVLTLCGGHTMQDDKPLDQNSSVLLLFFAFCRYFYLEGILGDPCVM